jgi:hypothetical protein
VILLATGALDVIGTILGLLLSMTGLALGYMGISAVAEGAPRPGLLGLAAGLLLLAVGLWLAGFL